MFSKSISNEICVLTAFSDFKTVFCAACGTLNIWCSSPFKLSLFLKTNTQGHLWRRLSFGTTILSVSTSSARDLISNLIWKYPPSSLVSPWPLFLTWLSLAFTLCNPGIQHTWPKECYLRWEGFINHKVEGYTNFHRVSQQKTSLLPHPLLHILALRTETSNDNFFSCLKGLAHPFCNSPGWEHSCEIYVPWRCLLRYVWRAKRFFQANRH